jgi:maltose O-acetyltransferase
MAKATQSSINWRKRLGSFLMLLTLPFPNFGLGLVLRGWLYSKIIINCGKRFKLAPLVNIYNPSKVKIGNDVYIGYSAYIGDGDITLCDEVVIGPFCSLTAGNHLFRDNSVRFGGYEYKPVSIGKGTWLGANVNVLAGVTIGSGCLVAAGAVVTRDIPDNSIAVGAPAKVIGPNDGASGVQAFNQDGMK